MKTFYTASKVKHAPLWRSLRKRGYPINSTWIDEAGEGESADYSELATRCVNEIRSADFILLYCKPGQLLKGALIEAGIALALGKEVRCVGNCHTISRVFKSHPLWKKFPNILTALKDSK